MALAKKNMSFMRLTECILNVFFLPWILLGDFLIIFLERLLYGRLPGRKPTG